MFEVGKLIAQLLEISKQLAAGSMSFELTLKTEDIDFVDFSSQDKEVIPKYPRYVKKKSPRQMKQDFRKWRLYLEKKLNKYNSKPFEENNTKTKIS